MIDTSKGTYICDDKGQYLLSKCEGGSEGGLTRTPDGASSGGGARPHLIQEEARGGAATLG